MSKFYAFVSEEYYEAWATTEVESGRQPTHLRFVQEYGTPYLYYHNRYSKGLNYILICSEERDSIRINFNYYSDLRLGYPNVVLPADQPEIFSFMRHVYDWFSGLSSKLFFSKRSTIAPI